jgi:hypothetical protein
LSPQHRPDGIDEDEVVITVPASKGQKYHRIIIIASGEVDDVKLVEVETREWAISWRSGMHEPRRQQGGDGVGEEGPQSDARVSPARRAAGVGRWRPDKPPATARVSRLGMNTKSHEYQID